MAQTATWVGTGNNADWHTASNWSPAVVPGPASTVVIPAGSGSVLISTADVTVTTLTVNRPLTLGPSRTLTATTSTLSSTLDLGGGTWGLSGRMVTFNSGATVQNGTLATTGGTLTLPSSCNALTLKNLTINGDLNLTNSGIRWSNVTLNGAMNISGSSSSVRFEGNNTLNFAVNITGTPTVYFDQATAGTLTIPAGRTIAGASVGFNTSNCGSAAMTLINNGTITASTSGYTVSFGSTVTLTNNGTINASVGKVTFNCPVNPLVGTFTGNNFTYASTVDLGAGTWNLSGRTVTLGNGSIVQNGTLAMNGGTLGSLANCNNATTLKNLTINGDLNLIAGAMKWVNVTLNGALIVTGSNGATVGFPGNSTINFPVNINGPGGLNFYTYTVGTLTIASDVTISGGYANLSYGGSCSNAMTALINNGTIDANISGQTIGINAPVTNNETIRASNGGAVNISGALTNNGTVNSTGGRVTLSGGVNPLVGTFSGNNFTYSGTLDLGGGMWSLNGRAVTFNSGTTVQNGTLETTGGTLTISSNYCDALTLKNLTINGDLNLTNALIRWSNVTLNGAVNISGGSVTLNFEGNTTLNFPVNITGTAGIYFGQATAGTLTIPAGRTISGATVGFNTSCGGAAMTLINNGTLLASTSGQTWTFGSTVTLTNNGSINASVGNVTFNCPVNPLVGMFTGNNFTYASTVDLGAGTWNLSGRTVSLSYGASLQNGTLEMGGGTLASSANCYNGVATMKNLTINGDLNLTSGVLRWENVTLNGSMYVTGSGVVVGFPGNSTISFPVNVNSTGGLTFYTYTTGTLTIASGVTISGGYVNLSNVGGTCGSAMTALINNGTIDANISGRTTSIRLPVTNNGTIRASNGGAVNISGALTNNGTVNSTGGRVTLSGGVNPLVGTFSGNNFTYSGTLDLGGGMWSLNGREVTFNSGTTVQNGTLETMGGTLTIPSDCNALTLKNLTINGDLNLTNSGIRWSNVTLNGAMNISGSSSSVRFEGNNTLNFAVNITGTPTVYFDQATAGTLTIPAGRTIAGASVGFNTSNCGSAAMTLINNGTITASTSEYIVLFGSTVTLTNNGTINASVGKITFNCPVSPLVGTFTGNNFTYASTVDLGGGTWNLSGRAVRLSSGARLQNGTLTMGGGSLASLANCDNAANLKNLTINGDLNLTSGLLRWENVILNGALIVTGSNDATVGLPGNSTINFPVNVNSTGGLYIYTYTSGTLTIASGVTISGGHVVLSNVGGACGSAMTAVINNGIIDGNIPSRPLTINVPYYGTGALWGAITLNGMSLTAPFSFATSANNAAFTGTRLVSGGVQGTLAFRSLDVSGISLFTLDTGETLNLNGGQGNLRIGNQAAFDAKGAIRGNIINSGLLVMPINRAAAGQISTMSQSSTGVLRMFIASSAQGETYSQLSIGQTANLNGGIQVVLQPELFGYSPNIGDSFDIITAAGGITLPVAPAALNIQTLMTRAGAEQLGLTLPAFNSGFAGDPNQLVSLPANIFTYFLLPDGKTLRITLTQPVCGTPPALVDVGACPTSTAIFTATTAGSGPFTYSWEFKARPGQSPADWIPLTDGTINAAPGGPFLFTASGATTSVLTLDRGGDWPLSGFASGGFLRSTITGPCGTTTRTVNFGILGTRCSPADIGAGDGEPLPPFGGCGSYNPGLDGGDFDCFFNFYFAPAPDNAVCDIAYGDGEPLPPFGPEGGFNPGVDGGDFDCFFNFYFNGCL